MFCSLVAISAILYKIVTTFFSAFMYCFIVAISGLFVIRKVNNSPEVIKSTSFRFLVSTVKVFVTDFVKDFVTQRTLSRGRQERGGNQKPLNFLLPW